jgi:DNA-binding transcriptional LysR family regulator
MDIDQLVAFDRVVREGSFSRAALSLQIGQPAISARIHALEEKVGGELFVRRRRVALTPLGESFLPYARRALLALDEGFEAARAANSGERGRVRLGTLGSLEAGLVGPAVAEFVRAHPDVDCLVRSGERKTILGYLWEGIVDLAIVTWPSADPLAAELTPILTFTEPVRLVAAPGHPLALCGPTVSEADLVRLARPLFLVRWWQTHDPRIVQLAQLTHSRIELSLQTARQLALRGGGVGFFARTCVAEDLATGTLVELCIRSFPSLSRGYALVRRRRSMPLSPAATALIEALAARARRL